MKKADEKAQGLVNAILVDWGFEVEGVRRGLPQT
jgi:hypothetical protein